MVLDALFITGKALLLAVPLMVVIGVFLGVVLARTEGVVRVTGQVIVLLPLVLPPTVVGYGLLMMLGQRGLEGILGMNVLFSWPAASLASCVVGIPLVVMSTHAAVENVPEKVKQAAETLGSGQLGVLCRVTLPIAWPGILAGIVLGTARAMGEFGATIMIAGNIPGRTQTVSLAVYEAVQTRQYEVANVLVILLTVLCALGVLMVNRLELSSPTGRA